VTPDPRIDAEVSGVAAGFLQESMQQGNVFFTIYEA
jgi:hypothetical protein